VFEGAASQGFAHGPDRPASCGGFMPTAKTTLIPASGINQRAAKKSLQAMRD